MPKSRGEGEQGQMYTSETYGSNDLTPPASSHSPIVHSVWTHQWTYPSMKLAPSWCNNVFSLAPLPGNKIFKTSSLGGYFISKYSIYHGRHCWTYTLGRWICMVTRLEAGWLQRGRAPLRTIAILLTEMEVELEALEMEGEALRTCLITQSSPWQLVEVPNWLTKK